MRVSLRWVLIRVRLGDVRESARERLRVSCGVAVVTYCVVHESEVCAYLRI